MVALAHAALLPLEVDETLFGPAQTMYDHSPKGHSMYGLVHFKILERLSCIWQQLEGVRDGVNHLGTAMNLQGDLLMQLGDKSIPTMLGLGGEILSRDMRSACTSV